MSLADSAKRLTEYEQAKTSFIFQDPQPYPHQRQMFEAILRHKKYGLFAEMGLGKTRVVIDVLQYLKDTKKNIKGIILCPKSLISVWIEEADKWGRNLNVVGLKGSTKQKTKALKDNKNADVFVTNYETLLSNIDFGSDVTLVALDESQKIKNHKARRTKVLLGYYNKRIYSPPKFADAEYKILLTGTPITKNPLDLYTQISFIHKGYLGKSFYSFRGRYAVMGGYLNYQIVRYKNLKELEDKVSKKAIILKKQDCISLPDKIYEKRILEMPANLKRQYVEMENEALIEFKKETIVAPIVLTKMLRLQEITSGKYVEPKDNLKLKEVIDIVEENDGQIVIWTRFKHSLFAIYNALSKDYSCALFYGDTPERDRARILDEFKQGNIKVFIGQLSAGGVGINLQTASLTVYYENTFSLADRMQSEDRTHRIGQTNNPVYIDLFYANTIDEKIFKAIQKKQDFAETVLQEIKNIRR